MRLPKKARANRPEEIRRCVACNQGCEQYLFKVRGISCIHNPEVGREAECDEAVRQLSASGSAARTLREVSADELGRLGHAMTPVARKRARHVVTENARVLAEVGPYVDVVMVAEDLGTQTGPMISPAAYRRMIKPAQRRVWQSIKRQTAAKLFLHSCGSVRAFIPDLIEIGVDVINSQTAVVGLDWIASNVRGRVAFRTDIDRQHVLPLGSPSQVKEEVHRTFETCGTAEGGIIACGEIAPDVPLVNVRAMYEAFWQYGRYR